MLRNCCCGGGPPPGPCGQPCTGPCGSQIVANVSATDDHGTWQLYWNAAQNAFISDPIAFSTPWGNIDEPGLLFCHTCSYISITAYYSWKADCSGNVTLRSQTGGCQCPGGVLSSYSHVNDTGTVFNSTTTPVKTCGSSTLTVSNLNYTNNDPPAIGKFPTAPTSTGTITYNFDQAGVSYWQNPTTKSCYPITCGTSPTPKSWAITDAGGSTTLTWNSSAGLFQGCMPSATSVARVNSSPCSTVDNGTVKLFYTITCVNNGSGKDYRIARIWGQYFRISDSTQYYTDVSSCGGPCDQGGPGANGFFSVGSVTQTVTMTEPTLGPLDLPDPTGGPIVITAVF